jgi:hypothetical protein
MALAASAEMVVTASVLQIAVGKLAILMPFSIGE